MAIEITQSQYNTTKQSIRNLHIKLNILNFNFKTIDSIEGNCTAGTIQINANSDIRRTCSLSFVVTDDSLEMKDGGEIFLDKYIQVYIGIEDTRTGKIAWNNMGIYLINQPTYDYDAITHTLSFQGVDLMAKLTGIRNGYIGGLAGEDITLIQTGQNVREVIIGILKENNFNRYVVSECQNVDGTIQEVPYDMEFSQGSTWYDILSEIRNILPQYQIYFDVNGVFHYETIPSSAEEPVMMNDDIWIDNVISEQDSVDFENVKNAVEVYGVTHDTQYFSDVSKSVASGNTISLTVDEEFAQTEYVEVGFVLPNDADGNITINVNSLGAQSLVDSNGDFITHLDADTYWIISYQSNDTWLFLGHLQAQGYWEDDNPESPFYIDGPVGKILIPLYGEDYDNIQSDELALQRAKYEIYKRCRLNDTLRLTTVPIYWADVNWKVDYTPLNKKETNQYITQSIYTDLSEAGQQTWEMSRFYPFYPVIN